MAFRRDLGKYLKQCRESYEEILLLGDFNENIGSDQDAMQKLMDENDLMDARGQKCLDCALATSGILINTVVKAGYEAFNAKFPTDHRAYYVDLAIDQQLFKVQIQPLTKYEPRILKSNESASSDCLY